MYHVNKSRYDFVGSKIPNKISELYEISGIYTNNEHPVARHD
jgi:hypothetical protein